MHPIAIILHVITAICLCATLVFTVLTIVNLRRINKLNKESRELWDETRKMRNTWREP